MLILKIRYWLYFHKMRRKGNQAVMSFHKWYLNNCISQQMRDRLWTK